MEGHLAVFSTLSLAPFDIGTDVFGFALCDAAVYRDIKLGAGIGAVDALFLEVYIHADVFEYSDIFKAVDRVSCEPAD